jgi:hypothetical protein
MLSSRLDLCAINKNIPERITFGHASDRFRRPCVGRGATVDCALAMDTVQEPWPLKSTRTWTELQGLAGAGSCKIIFFFNKLDFYL